MENGLDCIRREKLYRKLFSYEYLNERGLDELDLINAALMESNDFPIHCHRMMV
jgi:hypothetical protein